MFSNIFFISLMLLLTTVNGCVNFARGPFATANKDNWKLAAATDACKTHYSVGMRGDSFIWSGDFCTVSATATPTEADELDTIFITKWYCANTCYNAFWQVAVFNYVNFGCVHGGAAVDSENPYDVTVKCECGPGLTTPGVTFQQIHEEFMTSCSSLAPITNCQAPTAPQTGVTLNPSEGQFVWTDGTYQTNSVMTAKCANPAEVILSGEITTTCQPSGQWTTDPVDAVCGVEVQCSSLDDIKLSGGDSNKNWTYSTAANSAGSFAVDTNAALPCAPGYARSDGTNIIYALLTCTAEGWTPELPCCIPLIGCSLLDDFPLANTDGKWAYEPTAEGRKVPVGTTAKIMCKTGYISSETGSNEVTVTCTDKWSTLEQCVQPLPCYRADFQLVIDSFPGYSRPLENNAQTTASGDSWTFDCPERILPGFETMTLECANGVVLNGTPCLG